METEYLCYVKYVGKDSNEKNIYELLFTTNPESFWGENFEYMPCCLCNELIPNKDEYNLTKTIYTNIKLSLVTESCCNSMQDCMDGIIALAWEDISDYDEYPESGRIVLKYGLQYEDVEEMLINRNIILE